MTSVAGATQAIRRTIIRALLQWGRPTIRTPGGIATVP